MSPSRRLGPTWSCSMRIRPTRYRAGRSWRGTPYQLGDKTYTNGLAIQLHQAPAGRSRPAGGTVHRGGRAGEQRRHPARRRDGSRLGDVPRAGRRQGGPDNPDPATEGRASSDRRPARRRPAVRDPRQGRRRRAGLGPGALGGCDVKLQDGGSDPAPGSAPRRYGPQGDLVHGAPLLIRLRRQAIGRSAQDLAGQPQRREARRPSNPAYADIHRPRNRAAGPLRPRPNTTISPQRNGRSTSRTPARPTRPILSKIQALDIRIDRSDNGEFLLHHNVGSPANGNDYGPLQTPLGPGVSKHLGGSGGRPTNTDWSYFNLEWGGEGVIVAVGWPGQWAAEFVRDASEGPAPVGRPGTDPLQAAAGRGSPQPADRAAVLERRLDRRPERLASLDDGALDAQARRQSCPRRSCSPPARASTTR